MTFPSCIAGSQLIILGVKRHCFGSDFFALHLKKIGPDGFLNDDLYGPFPVRFSIYWTKSGQIYSYHRTVTPIKDITIMLIITSLIPIKLGDELAVLTVFMF
jgi:hypothetical protein